MKIIVQQMDSRLFSKELGMRSFSSIVISALLSFAASCEHPSAFKFTNLSVDFRLVDATGEATETFAVGEDIRFLYSVTNQSGSPIDYAIQDAGPIVRFEVVRQDSLVGTSDDGMGYAQVIVEGGLNPGETISWQYNWLSVEEHEPLPAGDYLARAQPRLSADRGTFPPAPTLPFSIISTSDVVITDQDPATLQLHRFQLDSVKVVGDSLVINVSVSGGCAEHEYTLFMSPPAFLESFPVQANLFLRHDDKNDPCDAFLSSRVSFNVKPLAVHYQRSYNRIDPIILNVFEFFENNPGESLSVTYTPQ